MGTGTLVSGPKSRTQPRADEDRHSSFLTQIPTPVDPAYRKLRGVFPLQGADGGG